MTDLDEPVTLECFVKHNSCYKDLKPEVGYSLFLNSWRKFSHFDTKPVPVWFLVLYTEVSNAILNYVSRSPEGTSDHDGFNTTVRLIQKLTPEKRKLVVETLVLYTDLFRERVIDLKSLPNFLGED